VTDSAISPEPPFDLLLREEEVPVIATALRLLISDEAHEPQIRRLAREVLAKLPDSPWEDSIKTISLAPQQMKITHTGLKLLLDDGVREKGGERAILQSILAKLPDQHTMRAIELG
jgi:hypothetical protein